MKKILVVDDSSFMRMIIKNALAEMDIQIIEAKDGEKAVELFQSENPDLVTMDVTMPKKTGLEALVEMIKINKEAKIIMCSSMVNQRTDEEAKIAGAIDFIKKPFQDKEFKKIVEKYLYQGTK